MFKTILATLITIYSLFLNAKPLVIAIVDTGIDTKYLSQVKICKNGLIDLTRRGIDDEVSHGTNIVGTVSRGLSKIDHCFILIKFYTPGQDFSNFMRSTEAFNILWKMRESLDMIVMAGGGPGSSPVEQDRFTELLDSGVIIVTAIGNDGRNMDEDCYFYPACYDKRIIVVGNGDREKKRLIKSSSYGKVVDIYEDGRNVCSFGVCMSGTSQSTAIVANKIILRFNEFKQRLKEREVRNVKKRK